MKKVGLVTLYSKNYGSALQCYSLRTIIQKRGFQCNVLFRKLDGIKKYTNKLNTLFQLVQNSVLHPSYAKAFLKKRKSSELSIRKLSAISEKQLDDFVRISIQPLGCSDKLLKEYGKSTEYAAFITGSDQVWNGISPYQPFYFLNFVPKEKRVAYAPSFGGTTIKAYNRRYFSKSITNFRLVSVRENEGREIVKKLANIEAERLPDPTVLLTTEEWTAFAQNDDNDEYILIHFLDKLSTNAMNTIKKLHYIEKIPIVCFAYPHEEFRDVHLVNVDGGPEDYVGYIKNAKYLFTDSFHTTIFAIRFDRQFFVYPRQYQYGNEQSSRIISLLKNCNYEKRYMTGSTSISTAMEECSIHDCKPFFEVEREKAVKFLDRAIGKENNLSDSLSLKDDSECVGCGVCKLVCPKSAISMDTNSKGYELPVIDSNKCIHCQLCAKVCRNSYMSSGNSTKDLAYIAFNKDLKQRKESASGGIFSALAKEILEAGGLVYGATLFFIKGMPVLKHIQIERLEELPKVLGSKYAQSDCTEAFYDIKSKILTGKIILFCGTSCQVDALYRFLGQRDYLNLYTIDLICHGVPGNPMFKEYIRYISQKKRMAVSNYTFRNKSKNKILYEETIRYSDGDEIKNKYEDSLYCKMFLSRSNYRECCYNCQFASVNKPADLTIGDYFEAQADYPELFSKGGKLETADYLSCMLVNTNHGHKLIEIYGNGLEKEIVDKKVIQLSHDQLCAPSQPSSFKIKFFRLYEQGGFKKIEKYYSVREKLLYLPKKLLKK